MHITLWLESGTTDEEVKIVSDPRSKTEFLALAGAAWDTQVALTEAVEEMKRAGSKRPYPETVDVTMTSHDEE